ncbi:MAG TPA: PAS domain-containing sensor histidine kinase [Gammaproteobacteria bacterium]|nr:PAS domain-containing sensor histidine kinase [Gammaproteobacteria bacterium]
METAVLLFGRDMQLLAINPAGENLLQASTRMLVGRSADMIFSSSERCRKTLVTAAEENRAITRRELSLHISPGNDIIVDCSVTPVVQDRGKPELIVEITRIDRLMRLAREDYLQSQYEATRNVLRGIAHEVKNPLGGLRGAAQLLDMEISDPELKEFTQIIIREADRLSGMVDKMAGPNKMLQLEPVNIHTVTEDVRGLVAAEFPDLVRLETDYDPSLPDIRADHDALVQVILNLSRNAVQAMLDAPDATNGAPNRLIYRTRVASKFTIGNTMHRMVLRLDIEDNGPGIPNDLQDTVFYPLITSKAEGSGLGLSIVQTIISQHNGLVEFISKPGKTVFSIYLPLE